MPTIPIVSLRKSKYTEHDIKKLKKHNWFMAASKGNLMFQPDQYMTEHETKKVLKEYLSNEYVKKYLPDITSISPFSID